MIINNSIGTRGGLVLDVTRSERKASLLWKVRNMARWIYIKGWLAKHMVGAFARRFGIATMMAELRGVHYKVDGSSVDYGVLGRYAVTTDFCEDMVDELITETSAWGNYKFHDMGTGTTNEGASNNFATMTVHGAGDSGGTQVESTSVGYSSVGTITAVGTAAITEHCLSNVNGADTVMDRTKFTAVNVISGDSIQFTYTLTCTAGG